jgi:hypothetical protein
MRVLVSGVGIGIMCASLLMSCKKPSSTSKTDVTIQKDSLVYIETVREVKVKVPGDTVEFRVEIPCPDNVKSKPVVYKSQSKRAKIDLTFDKGVVSGNCICDSLELIVQAKDRYIKDLQKLNVSQSQQSEFVKTKYGKWFWYLLAWFVASILYIVIKIYLKFKPL